MGADIFLLSGAVAVTVMGIFTHSLYAVLPVSARENQRHLAIGIVGVFAVVNILYFTDIMPPIPLALKDAGVYHYVARTSAGVYEVAEETHNWYDFFRLYKTVHVEQGQPLYFYSAVFAPTRLSADIVHVWQYYNGVSGKWTDASKIKFPIYGGMDNGYRGYSEKISLMPGKWRVDVETDRGQTIGRTRFEIVYTPSAPPLTVGTK
jgi:hypothetical protein